jgi:hypothetical protein
MGKKQTFTDVLGDRLGKLAEGARTAIALDPRRVLTVPSPFLDASDRDWEVFVYDRNDLELRSLWRSVREGDKRLLIVALGSPLEGPYPHQIDLSYVPDIVEEAEAIIDCSPQGLVHDLFEGPLPADLFEEPLLSQWAGQLDRFLAQLRRHQKISGKGGVLNRFDITGVVLSAIVPGIKLEDIVELPQDPFARLLFYIRGTVENRLSDDETDLLREVISGPIPNEVVGRWCSFEREELLRFLYLGLVVLRYAVPKGIVELERLGLLGFELDHLGDSPEKMINLIRKDLELVRTITTEAEKSSSLLTDLEKLVGRFRFGSYMDGLNAFDDEPCPAVACCLGVMLIRWVLSSSEGKKALALWYKTGNLHKDRYPKTPLTNSALKFRELFRSLSWLEFTLSEIPAPPQNLLDLVTTYRKAKIHLLELTAAQVYEAVRLMKDQGITEPVKLHMEAIQSKLDSCISGYDQSLSDAISRDWAGYTRFQRLNTHTLRDLIQAGVPKKERVWIIILDGMRLDSWDHFVWPRLREFFEVEGEEQLYLATLPSYTDISRVAFLAGKLPPFWKDYANHYTSDHNILLSRHLGLGKDEGKKKLKILGRVEEKTEQTEFDFDPAQYCGMIFNLSDDWIHHETGSLVRVNDIVQDKFEKLVLPELEYRIKPEDIVVVTSDHGFIELRQEFMQKVTDLPNEDVAYRYIKDAQYDGGVCISYDDKTRWTVAVGHKWFQRPKAKGKPSRYSHGGISMAEMVVPAFRLRLRTRKEVVLVLLIDDVPEVTPGDQVTLRTRVQNQGTVTTNVSLTCRLAGHLIAQEDLLLPGGTSHEWPVMLTADPKATQVTVSAEYSLPDKKKRVEKRQVLIPIKETGAKVEIDTSALDDFEDI